MRTLQQRLEQLGLTGADIARLQAGTDPETVAAVVQWIEQHGRRRYLSAVQDVQDTALRLLSGTLQQDD